MKRSIAALLILLGLASAALAQRIQAPGNVAIGCAYNTAPPTLTTGWFGYVQCDNTGKLIVSGGGGGGGGAVTIADGADVALGTTTDAVAATPASGAAATLIALAKAINNNIASAIPAGTAIIGKIGVDQTTPGTTNGVALVGVNAATALAGAGAVGTGSARVAVGQDTTTIAGSAPGTAGTASANVLTIQHPSVDPCETIVQTSTPISITTATTTRIVAPTSAKKTYICYMFLTSAAADNVGIVEGTGGTCGTGTAGVIGGTTAANGPNFSANGGVSLTAGGKTAVAYTAGTNVDLCLITSAATPLAGTIKWVQAP